MRKIIYMIDIYHKYNKQKIYDKVIYHINSLCALYIHNTSYYK